MQERIELATTESGRPRVWLVVGEKIGDNAQIHALAEELGWLCEERRIVIRPDWVVRKPRVRPTLHHVDRERSDPLDGPWPDLVITAGRRLSCVGLWIKRASGGRTRLVLLGKPRRLLGEFDLAVMASHFVMPPAPNVLRHDLPLMRVDAGRIQKAVACWREELAPLERPITAMLVGGPTGALRFDLDTTRALLAGTLADVEASGGSLCVVTSPRTPPGVIELIRREAPLGTPVFVFGQTGAAAENPYHALLGLAERFVVTSDSVSMMVEVARLDASMAIHPLEVRTSWLERLLARLGWLAPLSPRTDMLPAGGLRARLMNRLGRPIHSRDLSGIARLLVERGRAGWLGDAPIAGRAWSDDEIRRVAERVRGLLGKATRSAGSSAPV